MGQVQPLKGDIYSLAMVAQVSDNFMDPFFYTIRECLKQNEHKGCNCPCVNQQKLQEEEEAAKLAYQSTLKTNLSRALLILLTQLSKMNFTLSQMPIPSSGKWRQLKRSTLKSGFLR